MVTQFLKLGLISEKDNVAAEVGSADVVAEMAEVAVHKTAVKE